MSSLPRGTVTLVYADIADSTRLDEELGTEWDALLDAYEETVRATVAAHDGHVVDHAGDKHLLAFARAGDAVEAAVAFQRAVAELKWPGAGPAVAVGVHTDEPRVRGDRYSGVAVHRVVRVASLAHGGQTLLTGATHRLVAGDLPAGTSVRELGEHELRGVQRPEPVYELMIEGLRSAEVVPVRREAAAATTALPGGTVTFLFADVEGSTRLLREFGEGWSGGLAAYRGILRETFGAAGGREVDRQGDGFFFVFGRARAAVGAAADAQRRLAAHEWPEGVNVRVRMGLHTGEPSLEEEGYLGLDVVRAARICAAGHGGQVLLSATTHALAAGEPIEGVGTLDLGEHQLKDMPNPERIHQLVIAGLQTRFEPLRTAGEGQGEALTLATERSIDQLAREVDSFARDLRTEIEQKVVDGLRARSAARPPRPGDERPPLPPAERQQLAQHAVTRGVLLAGFMFLVLVVAVVVLLYLLLG